MFVCKEVMDSERSSLQNVEARTNWRENSGSRVALRACSVARFAFAFCVLKTGFGLRSGNTLNKTAR